MTFVTTSTFLDHFGLESARDLPGLKELREAGLLDNRPPGSAVPVPSIDEIDADSETDDLFED